MSDKKFENRQKKTSRGLNSLFVPDDSQDRESQLIDRSVVEQDSANNSNYAIVNVLVRTSKKGNLETTALTRDLAQDLKA